MQELRIVIAPPSTFAADEIQKKKWQDALSTDTSQKGGQWLRMAEQIAFVAAFSFFRKDVPLLIGGWLAFKIAAKWEAWGNIHKFPDKFTECPDRLEELRARNEVGSITLTRFLLGTLGNILVSTFGYFCAKGVILVSVLVLGIPAALILGAILGGSVWALVLWDFYYWRFLCRKLHFLRGAREVCEPAPL
jgi:hypothetical protein